MYFINIVPHRLSSKGKPIVKPYKDSEREIEPICKKTFPNHKILVYKTWEGNSFGYSSLIFIWDTKKNVVYNTINSYTFDDIVRYVEKLEKDMINHDI